MADIVNSLFGVNVGELQNRQWQQDSQMAQSIAGAYNDPRAKIGALVGANIAQGLGRGLFNVQDPMINKAKQFEQILQQTQAEAGDNPVEMYKALAKNLGQAGFAREAQQALQQGVQLEQTMLLNNARLTTAQSQVMRNIAQANKAALEKKPQIEQLITLRDQYLEDGDQSSANMVQKEIDKRGYTPASKPQDATKEAERQKLADLVEQFGETEGANKYLEWVQQQKLKRSAVSGTGSVELKDSDGNVIGSTNKKGDVTLKSGQVVPSKEYSGYSAEQEAGLELLNKLNNLDDDTIGLAFGKPIDTTKNELAALAAPQVNGAQVAVQAVRVKETLDNLMALKGPTSDKDMQVVMSTFPSFGSSPQTMRDWIVRAKVASVKFLTKRAEKFGFEPPAFDFTEFVSDPVFQNASKKEKMKALSTFRGLPSVWGQADEPTQIRALAAAENGAAEIKQGDKTTFSFGGKDYVRPPYASDDQWNKYKAYITSGAK